jgi:Na+/H+-dicarboxylate symporter
MDTVSKNEKTNELLANWSKWLITINVFAATGCIVGLKTAGEATQKVAYIFLLPYFHLAFLLCVLHCLFFCWQRNISVLLKRMLHQLFGWLNSNGYYLHWVCFL